LRTQAILGLAAIASMAACSTLLGFEPLSLDESTADGGGGTGEGDGGAALDGALADGRVPRSDGDTPDGMIDPGTCTGDLTSDAKNCGRCGHDCLGGTCNKGVCTAVKLVDGLAVPTGLAVDDASVFVAAHNSSRIFRFPKSEVTTTCGDCVFADQPSVMFPTAVAVDGENVYWANTPPDTEHEIRACPRAGCGGSGGVLVAKRGVNAFRNPLNDFELLPLNLVVRNGRVYWGENGYGAIRSAPIDGGETVTYLENDDFTPVDIAVDDAFVYFTDNSKWHPTRIQAAPLDGGARDGAVKIIATTPAPPFGIALSTTGTLYYTILRIEDVGDGVVEVAPKEGVLDGGATVGEFATSQVEPNSVLVDAKNVYWAQAGADDAATGMIVYCALAGCPVTGPIVLATQQNRPHHLAQDNEAIYWTNEGLLNTPTDDGQVWKVAKP
jgi:hypothetical protein